MQRACLAYCPFCYSNRKGRSNYKGHYGYKKSTSDKAVSVMAILRKAVPPATTGVELGCWLAPDGSELMPAMREFLTMCVWEDGSARATGTLVAFADGGVMKVLLNDKDADRIAVVSGKTFYDAVEAAEEGLALDSLDWRRNRQPQGRGGKRS